MGRRIVIFAFNIIIFLRMAYMMFFLLKRKIAWEESISLPIAFAIYFIGFSLFALPAAEPPGGPDWFASAVRHRLCSEYRWRNLARSLEETAGEPGEDLYGRFL